MLNGKELKSLFCVVVKRVHFTIFQPTNFENLLISCAFRCASLQLIIGQRSFFCMSESHNCFTYIEEADTGYRHQQPLANLDLYISIKGYRDCMLPWSKWPCFEIMIIPQKGTVLFILISETCNKIDLLALVHSFSLTHDHSDHCNSILADLSWFRMCWRQSFLVAPFDYWPIYGRSLMYQSIIMRMCAPLAPHWEQNYIQDSPSLAGVIGLHHTPTYTTEFYVSVSSRPVWWSLLCAAHVDVQVPCFHASNETIVTCYVLTSLS